MLNSTSIRSIIKGVLANTRLELRRRYKMPDLLSFPVLPTAGWTIEFIGTMGVGKSTLFNHSVAKLDKRWFFRYHLRDIILSNVQSENLSRLYRDVFFRKIEHLNAHVPDAWQSVRRARALGQVVYESLLISSHTFPRGFALEEGIFKNYPEEVMALSDEEAAPMWEKRAFVYLRAKNPETAVARYRKRMATRQKKGWYQHSESDGELCARIESDNALYDSMMEKARERGSPLILISAESNMKDSVSKVLAFERSLIASCRDFKIRRPQESRS